MKLIIGKITLLTLGLSFSYGLMAQEGNKEIGMDKMWGQSSISADALSAERGRLFDESNFGMFINMGLYSHLGGKWKDKTYYGIGEWIMNPQMAGIPVEEYMTIADEFNPTDFDAKAIALLAKDAGMKYIIIDTKHHEGFAMFDSEVDTFNIVDATPFARDPMKEMASACHELGLGLGFYYSHYQDWTSPGGFRGPTEYPDGTSATFEDYFYKKCKPQVIEICSNYGDIDFIWFDTPGNMKKELVIELVDVIRELQPKAMLCSRIGHGLGDYASKGDMEVPLRNITDPWETCDTNNDSWGFTWYDRNFKSPKEILHRLISTVGRGGTYLFNIGPDGNGKVPEIGADFLRETGKWIQKYPQVIYDAGSSPYGHALPWGDVTTKGNSLFLSVFEWPIDGKLYLPGLDSKIVSIEMLSDKSKTKINFKKVNGWNVLEIPFKPADPLVSVIEVKLKKDIQTVKADTSLGIYPNIETQLLTEFAEVEGAEKEKTRWMEKFGEWKYANQVSKWTGNSKAIWTVDVIEPGYYHLDLRYRGAERIVWKVLTDEGIIVQNQQAATEKYQSYAMGIIEFNTPGKHTISVSLVEGDPNTSSLESVIIKPVR